MTAQQQRDATLDAIVAWLIETAERAPVLMAWEDLHWADPTTLETLGMLIEQAPTAALLVVATYRPELTPPWPQRAFRISRRDFLRAYKKGISRSCKCRPAWCSAARPTLCRTRTMPAPTRPSRSNRSPPPSGGKRCFVDPCR